MIIYLFERALFFNLKMKILICFLISYYFFVIFCCWPNIEINVIYIHFINIKLHLRCCFIFCTIKNYRFFVASSFHESLKNFLTFNI